MTVLCWLLGAYTLVVLAYVVFSWVPRPPEPLVPVVKGVQVAVDPVLAPLRRLIPPARMGAVALDLAVIVLFLILFILREAVC